MKDSDHAEQTFARALRAAIAPWGMVPTGAEVEALITHYRLMLEANRTTTLTRITDPIEAAVKHYADSLALAAWARDQGLGDITLVDVGTGAGFPAVPLAILEPAWRITAIDGTRKKIDFLRSVIGALGLDRLEVEHAHADHWDTDRTFDVVCARAVGSVAKCVPFASRLANPGGWFVAFKTVGASDRELSEATPTITEHRMRVEDPFDYLLASPTEKLSRRILLLRSASS